MNFVVKVVGLGLLILGTKAWADIPVQAPPLPTNEWNVTSAPARFVVEPDQPDNTATVSWVTLGLPNPNWANQTVRVFNSAGVAVGSDWLWSAPGEPATLMFDSSPGTKRYYVYVGSDWPAMHLANKAGVTLESRAGDGTTIDHLPDMQQAWDKSTTIYGRAMAPGLFEGGNRFGPQGNVLAHFQGWFNVANAEHLQLAAISTDASFVLVDGKEVVEWPGRHDFHPGLQGQFQGAVDLTPGLHSLEYYNAYVSSNEGRPLLCCLAAKGGALANWTMLTPDNNFFVPTAHAHIAEYQLSTTATAGDVPHNALEWNFTGQSVIAPDVADIGLIAMQFTCRPGNGTNYKWTFDDGTTAVGPNVQHLFPRPGMRTVKVDIDNGNQSSSLTQTINIHPNWIQLTTFQPQLVPEQLAEIMLRDPAAMPASDLAGCMAVVGTFKNSDGILKLIPSACDKMKDFNEADLPYFKDAALYLAREDLAHSDEATKLLQVLVDRCTQDKPSPTVTAVGSASRLGLASLTLRNTDHIDDVRKLLDGINVDSLNGEEHRQYDLLRADLALAAGDIAGAKKQYEALTGNPEGPDARSSIRRTAKISQARAFIDRKDLDAAEHALRQVSMRAPVETLTPDWALTRLRLYEEENLPVAAYLYAKRLLPLITDEGRSELLFQMISLAYAQGDNDLAKKSLDELLKKHPYSSEAAEAKQKWPGK
jgi:PKD repeat protein